MIVHVVLFRPRTDLTSDDRSALAAAFEAAVTDIPSVRRARLGSRVVHGRNYEQLMHAHYPFAAMLEFDDLAGLEAYLTHPAHDELAARFFEAFEEALMYDYELRDGADGAQRLR